MNISPKKSDTGYRLLSKNKAKFDERHEKEISK